ncbi:MAG: hypothetical protein ABH841_00470 [Candidatus Nealsonbacteria bacterium]
MLDDQDIQKLKEILATKEDLAKILTLEEFDQFRGEIKQDLNGLREAVQALVVSVDKLVKAVSDLKTEYATISNQVSRHEKWFQQIAEKLGMRLEY